MTFPLENSGMDMDYKQLLSKSEKDSLRHSGCKRGWASRYCEAVFVRTVLFVGKCGVRFRRCKKVSRALAAATMKRFWVDSRIATFVL